MADGRDIAPLKRGDGDLVARYATALKSSSGPSTELIPAAVLPVVIAELEAALQPTTPERAVNWARHLIGCFPHFKAHDPEVYVRGISSLFAETPEDLCREGVDRASRTFKFPPSRAEVHELLEGLRAARHRQLALARWMEREHGRRRAELEDAERVKADRARFRAKHGDRSPLDVIREEVGLPETKRKTAAKNP